MTKETKRGRNTQIRITVRSAELLRRLSRDLYKDYQKEHEKHGLRSPSSRVAIDYLIYEAAKAGIGSWPELNEENNLYMMIAEIDEEE